MNILRQIATDYLSGEITCVFLHDIKKDKKYNLLTVFELVPSEQQPSLFLGDYSSYYMKRESVNANFTIYLMRLSRLDVNEVLNHYENAENGMEIIYDKKRLNVMVEMKGGLAQEPPDYNPLLIHSNEDKTIGRILPYRNTAFRVWSKLNTDKNWLLEIDNKFFKTLTNLSREYLGYDLSAIQEHIGNVYLCASNPILRKWDLSLLDKNKDLLLSFFEREGKSIIDCRLVLEEDRSKNLGFNISQNITCLKERIELPYFPHGVHTKIYDRNGFLIDYNFGIWTNIAFTMNIQESVVNLEHGDETLSISKTSNVGTNTIGEFDLSTARYLREALNGRKFEEFEKNRNFIFFPKDDSGNTVKRARTIVREILNKARKRCIILDPYFGAQDLGYAIAIRNISIPIQIISSASFLKGSPNKRVSEKNSRAKKVINIFLKRTPKPDKIVTYAEELYKGIVNYKKQYPLQKIECKVLIGDKSPLHDRYILVDNEVYLLGSSLNEFGSRATTIIKVPTPEKMIAQALNWWGDDNKCPEIHAFVGRFNI